MSDQSLWPAFSRLRNLAFSSGHRVFVRGEGATLFDREGRAYFDAFSTLWTNLVGHGREEVVEAMAAQLRQLSFMHLFSGAEHEPALALSADLVRRSPWNHTKVFFGCSGSDATETAMKLARQYWFARKQPRKVHIIGRSPTYHGTSFGALSLMGHDDYQTPFQPLVPSTHRVAPNDLEELESLFARLDAKAHVAAFLVEPAITSDGLILSTPDYWARVQQLCKANDVLLICDEVSTGMGRAGTFYASTQYALRPDIAYLAKSLTSGYAPLSAVLCGEEIFDAIHHSPNSYFTHGYTFAGHPAACVAASSVLAILDRENLTERAARIGAKLRALFAEHLGAFEGRVTWSGIGSLFELTVHDVASETEYEFGAALHAALLARGQYVRVLGRHLCIAPPLVSTDVQLEELVATLGLALKERLT